MDDDNFTGMISTLALTALTSGLETRLQYLGVLISNVEKYIEQEKIEKDQANIINVKQSLVSAFNHTCLILQHNGKAEQLNEVKRYFKDYGIVLDQSWGSPKAVRGVKAVEEITKLNAARKMYREAISEYSSALAHGSADGLTRATILCDNIIKIVFSICYDNKLIDIEPLTFTKANKDRFNK